VGDAGLPGRRCVDFGASWVGPKRTDCDEPGLYRRRDPCNFWRAAVFWGRNRGENIMNTIQKAAFAASAFAITLVGAAFVTAPMAFATLRPVVAHQACATPSVQLTLAGRCDRGFSPTV
jgi:hypothetical protein